MRTVLKYPGSKWKIAGQLVNIKPVSDIETNQNYMQMWLLDIPGVMP